MSRLQLHRLQLVFVPDEAQDFANALLGGEDLDLAAQPANSPLRQRASVTAPDKFVTSKLYQAWAAPTPNVVDTIKTTFSNDQLVITLINHPRTAAVNNHGLGHKSSRVETADLACWDGAVALVVGTTTTDVVNNIATTFVDVFYDGRSVGPVNKPRLVNIARPSEASKNAAKTQAGQASPTARALTRGTRVANGPPGTWLAGCFVKNLTNSIMAMGKREGWHCSHSQKYRATPEPVYRVLVTPLIDYVTNKSINVIAIAQLSFARSLATNKLAASSARSALDPGSRHQPSSGSDQLISSR